MKLNKDNFVIGVTGGVGSGKSTVLDILREEHGAIVLRADDIGRAVIEPGGAGYERVKELFGKEALLSDGRPDRAYIAGKMFADPSLTEAMNEIVHPAVREVLEERARSCRGLLVLEAALPEGGGFREICDEIWYVYVRREERIARLIASRGYSRRKCADIMSRQLSVSEFRKLADRVIDNNGTREETASQVRSILKKIL